jgi:phospholipase D1/2
LISEHLGVSPSYFQDALGREGSFRTAVESLRGPGRSLQKFTGETIEGEGSLLAENDLMDPAAVPTSFSRSVQRWLSGLTARP